ncbi:hypothetical protein [Streptomyces uncialis]|uniref:hypothetical protein n=1 Tax=Streptomyces uncialis TaxID=1048205 RepID=UPI0038660D74|nr:hypothetical protein OG924_37045 [Streptomyces uncialis]
MPVSTVMRGIHPVRTIEVGGVRSIVSRASCRVPAIAYAGARHRHPGDPFRSRQPPDWRPGSSPFGSRATR